MVGAMTLSQTLDDLLDSGEVTVMHGRARCARCHTDLGPVAAVGLVVLRATAHIITAGTPPRL